MKSNVLRIQINLYETCCYILYATSGGNCHTVVLLREIGRARKTNRFVYIVARDWTA